jgi:hypothetical protein
MARKYPIAEATAINPEFVGLQLYGGATMIWGNV